MSGIKIKEIDKKEVSSSAYQIFLRLIPGLDRYLRKAVTEKQIENIVKAYLETSFNLAGDFIKYREEYESDWERGTIRKYKIIFTDLVQGS